MSDGSLKYNVSEQLVILWCCLGGGGFLSIVICCVCRFIRQRPNSICFFPTPLPLATPPQQSQQLQVLAKNATPLLTTSARQAAAVFERQGKPQSHLGSSDFIRQASLPQHLDFHPTASQQSPRIIQNVQKVSALKDTETSSDPMVQEMMMFTRQTLLRSGIIPSPVSTSDWVSSPRSALNTQPPADAAAAILEMTRYTRGVLEAMPLDRSHPKTSAV